MADTTLASLLQRIAELKNKKDEAQHILNCLKTDRKDAEETASELLLASGMQKVTSGGRTWWTSEQLFVSIPKEKREEVLEAAEKEGLREELTTVNTSTLKAWLVERAKENGLSLRGAAEGTAFDGLVSEFTARKLHSVRASQG